MFNSNQMLIETDDKNLSQSLFQLNDEHSKASEFIRKDFLNDNGAVSILISLSTQIGIGIIASYIYESFKTKPKSTTKIKNQTVNNNMNQIEIRHLIINNVTINYDYKDKSPNDESISN